MQGEIDLKRFKKLTRISKGSFGFVYQIQEKKTGEFYAAKIIDCDDNKGKCNEMVNREISIMMYTKHPTIIKFIGYSKVDFHDENNVTIIMELAKNGSLREVLRQIQQNECPENYTNTARQIILVGVARGMKYLHDRNIIHRDIKPENILLDENFQPHITDFGLSKFIEVGHSKSQTKFGGTLIYNAPEILKNQKYDLKVDVYSFGILMFEVLTDSVPYPEFASGEMSEFDFMNKIINQGYRPKFSVPVKDSLRELIEECWSENPSDRPTFDEIFNKLANKRCGEEEEENFLLDDVEMDKLNLYVKDITKITDSTEKLLSQISSLEEDNRQLKSEIKKLKEKEEQHQKLKATIIVGGYDKCNQLGEKPNNKSADEYGTPVICPPLNSSLDSSSLLSYSVYSEHSVLIMRDGLLLGIGDNSEGRISSSLTKTEISQFTEFSIKDDSGRQLAPISTFCNDFGTLYMFSKISGHGRQLVYCNKDIKGGDPVFLDIGDEEPVSLFGGYYHAAAISDKGKVIFINGFLFKNSPNSRIAAVSLPDGEKASKVALLHYSIVVLSSNGRLFWSSFESDSSVLKFSPVSNISGYEIVWLSGTFRHCLAVSKEGRVFGIGSNSGGQLGLGKEIQAISSFTEISSLSGYEIRAAYAGYWHSLFQTREGKILSCGYNLNGELLLSSGPSEERVYSPRETTITGGATFCIAGDGFSSVFVGGEPPPNTPNMPIHHHQ